MKRLIALLAVAALLALGGSAIADLSPPEAGPLVELGLVPDATTAASPALAFAVENLSASIETVANVKSQVQHLGTTVEQGGVKRESIADAASGVATIGKTDNTETWVSAPDHPPARAVR